MDGRIHTCGICHSLGKLLFIGKWRLLQKTPRRSEIRVGGKNIPFPQRGRGLQRTREDWLNTFWFYCTRTKIYCSPPEVSNDANKTLCPVGGENVDSFRRGKGDIGRWSKGYVLSMHCTCLGQLLLGISGKNQSCNPRQRMWKEHTIFFIAG